MGQSGKVVTKLRLLSWWLWAYEIPTSTHLSLSQFSVVMNEHRDYFFFDFMNIVFKRKLVSYLYSNVRRVGLAKFSKFKYLECINKQNLFHHYVNYINDIRIILKINYIFCCKNISYFPY